MIQKRFSGGLAAATLAAGSVVWTATALADVGDFYKGKTIVATIGYPPGGGYDAYMRSLSRHYGKHVPGNPTVVPRNMPGAGSLVAANYIYNTAPKDGTNIGIFASSTLFSVKLGEKQGKFDIAKFTWIGNMDQTVGTCVIHANSKAKSFKDLYTQEIVFGASGPAAVNSSHARGFNALFGTRIKIINGYPGSTQVLLAMSRGEVDGGCGFALSSLKTTRRQDWESGQIKPIIQTGFEKSDELKDVPHIYDFAKKEDDKKVMHVIYGTHILGRPVSAPPDLPADRAKALRAAFDATMKDKDFLGEAAKQDMPIQPWSGEQTEKVIAQFAAYPDAVYARAMKILDAGEVTNVRLKTVSGNVTNIAKTTVSVTDATGKSVKLKVHPKQTEFTIGGKEAKTADLKVGMQCNFEYFGENDLAPEAHCK